MKRAMEAFEEAAKAAEDEVDEHQRLQDTTNRALFELGRKVHELEKGLEYWAAQVRAIGEEIQDAIQKERDNDA